MFSVSPVLPDPMVTLLTVPLTSVVTRCVRDAAT